MKQVGGLALLAFGVTLALLIGQRMSTDAMAVVLGVAVGVAASVPTSLLLVALLRRERPGSRTEAAVPPAPAAPNVIVLNPADWAGGNLGAGSNRNYLPLPPETLYAPDGGMRRLRVVGDDDAWSEPAAPSDARRDRA